MFNFNEDRFVKVIEDALSLRVDLEKLIDDLYYRGFENLFWGINSSFEISF